MFSKQLECLDCGFDGKAGRELTYCPYCQSSNILTMSNKQVRQQRKRQTAAMFKVFNGLVREQQVIEDTFAKLSQL